DACGSAARTAQPWPCRQTHAGAAGSCEGAGLEGHAHLPLRCFLYATPPTGIIMHRINTIGIYTLCKREVWRFGKVWTQTVAAPVVTTLLFLAVLMLALGGSTRHVEDIPYDQFIAPGLIMMAIVQNAFANTSSS